MRFTDTLPTPPAEALAHSAELAARIRAAITGNGGSIRFHDFMQMALYEPGLGYYVAGLRKIGADGDFRRDHAGDGGIGGAAGVIGAVFPGNGKK